MSAYNPLPIRTFTAGESLGAYTRVKLNGSGQVVTAGLGATDTAIGVTVAPQTLQLGSGTNVPVLLFSSTGSAFVRAANAFAAGAPIYGAAAGKVSDTASGAVEGWALGAALAADDVVELLLKGQIG